MNKPNTNSLTHENILTLEGLMDLLDALQPELEVQPGLTNLWASELRRELAETLVVANAS